MQFLRQSYLSLPSKPGVYQFLSKENDVLYVGKAKDLKKRVSSYFQKSIGLGTKTQQLVSQIHAIECTIVESEIESLLLEANLIKKFSPKYNIRLLDSKAYPLIEITLSDDFPKVLISRRTQHPQSLYFGPFPSSKTVKTVLKTVRKIFPFQSVQNHPKRICLYNHLGLCPCPPIHNTSKDKKEYRKNIKHLVQFLEGNKHTVISELEKERSEYAENEEFEKAQKTQQQIDAIVYVTSQTRQPFEYEANPNLSSDLREKELDELKQMLNNQGVKIEHLKRIECYDISNISGTNATGSMVVLTNGEIDKSQYRKFKIYDIKGPNDFAMMEQILTRRFQHPQWPNPGLVVVDGGKGQISSALKALLKHQLHIPLVGLAKREEVIITSDFKEIRLPKNSPALKLVMRIRDEAHRFAVTYHKKLRSKSAFF